MSLLHNLFLQLLQSNININNKSCVCHHGTVKADRQNLGIMTSPNISRENSQNSLSSFDSDSELFNHEIFEYEYAGIGVSDNMASNSSMYLLLFFSMFLDYNEADVHIVKLLTGRPHLYETEGVCRC